MFKHDSQKKTHEYAYDVYNCITNLLFGCFSIKDDLEPF